MKSRITIDFNRVRDLYFVNDFVKQKKRPKTKVSEEIRCFWDALKIPA